MLNLLITSSIGSYTYNYGASELLISSEQLFTYLDQLVIPELGIQEGIDNLPMLKATSMKFIYFFRNQIPDAHIPQLVGMLAELLKSTNEVNKSYASACIEKLLIRKRLDNQGSVMTEQNLGQELLSKLLQNFCELLAEQKDLYAVRALLRVIQLSK